MHGAAGRRRLGRPGAGQVYPVGLLVLDSALISCLLAPGVAEPIRD